uniref:Photosystem I assembly protein Ycf3 n=1 Tax=Selaginella pallidissima TaxID=1715389 RepID=A0A7U3TXB4_9TRAC|nr:photosystem I assembly protein Ycf3 [Selaginella pallidissima]
MSGSRRNDNLVDKTLTIVADVPSRTVPITGREKEASTYHRDGMPAQSVGEYAEASRNHYEAARPETDPHDRSHIPHNIGPVHASSGEHARAPDHHSQALGRNPSPPQAPNNTAAIRHHRGERAIRQGDLETPEARSDRAADHRKQAVPLAPNNYTEAQNRSKVTGRFGD